MVLCILSIMAAMFPIWSVSMLIAAVDSAWYVRRRRPTDRASRSCRCCARRAARSASVVEAVSTIGAPSRLRSREDRRDRVDALDLFPSDMGVGGLGIPPMRLR